MSVFKNMQLQVGDSDLTNVNPNCATGINALTTPLASTTISCMSNGRYVFVVSGPNENAGLWIQEIQIFNPAQTCTCIGCLAGKYKDLTGDSACTNCPANTYSNFTAARNSSVCTPCYNNALAPAGSNDIWDCGCASGFEFY